MSDFSFFSLFTAGLACLVPLVSAYTQPVGDTPSGNPIYTPGLNQVVPAGQPFTITWGPTTEGTVTLVLLKGPSTNAVPQYAIVENIANSGSYVWTPSTDLEPTGDSGYGIQLIVDSDGQYQYSTQFGISNDNYTPSSSTSSLSGYGTSSTSTSTSSSVVSPSGYAAPTGGWPHGGNGTAHPTGGWGHHNTTQPKPTGHHVKPTWHHTKATTITSSTSYVQAPTSAQPVATATGAASNVGTSFFGFVAAAGIAVFAV